MSIGGAGGCFGATPLRGRSANRLCFWIFARVPRVRRRMERSCILASLTLGAIAVVKIVDAFLDALHNWTIGGDAVPPARPELKNRFRLQSSPVKIVIVDESPIRAAILEEGLRDAGFTEVHHIAERHNLLKRMHMVDPDVILIDLENPSRDELEQMFQVSRAVRRPIAMFVDQSDAASIQASVDAGVSAYIVNGLKKERIKSILDLCVSRFNAFAKLQSELERARSDLEERKTIDRAKGILMKAKKLSEDEAYRLMRGVAMRESKKIVEIAQSIITASELLK